jgi:hypothetical protein
MAWLYFMVLGPVAAGIVLVVVWWLIWGRKMGLPAGTAGASALAAGLILLLVGVLVRLLGGPLALVLHIPTELWGWYSDYRFTYPLVLGILGLVIVALPVRARSVRGTAELAPRTPWSYAKGSWFITPAVVLALIVTFTVAAGAASQPEEATGRYTVYWVDLGGERAMGTSIYGWFYSIPCLILIGVMIVIASIDLVLIARPALDPDHERDAHVRTVRTRNVVLIATGALLVHLGLIFGSLAATASVRSSFSTSDGSVAFWTPFAALQPTLVGASSVAAGLGFMLWAAVAVSAIPTRRRQPNTTRS